jgi:hypothetical protein
VSLGSSEMVRGVVHIGRAIDDEILPALRRFAQHLRRSAARRLVRPASRTASNRSCGSSMWLTLACASRIDDQHLLAVIGRQCFGKAENER